MLESVRPAGGSPEAQLYARLGTQLERAVQHHKRLLELVPPDRELGSKAEPGDRLRAKPLQLGLVAGPGQVGVLGPCGLRVVVCEQSRVLAAAVPDPLQPGGERGVEARAARLRDASVRTSRVSACRNVELTLVRQRGAQPPPHEVARLEQGEVGRHPVEQLANRAVPEDAADHGGRLQSGLLDLGELVDPGREDGVHVVRYPQSSRRVALLGQVRVQLLEEERVSLGALDEQRAHLARNLRRAQVVEQRPRFGILQRLEPDRLRVPAATPGGMPLEQLRPSRADEQQRPRDLVQRSFEQVEQGLLGPVEILHEHDRGLRGGQLRQERDAAGVQCFPRRERVELGVGRVAEHEGEDLVAAEPLRHRLGRVRLEQPQLLAEHVGDRAIRRAGAVGDTASGAPSGSGRWQRAPPRARGRAVSCRRPRPRRPSRAVTRRRRRHAGRRPGATRARPYGRRTASGLATR